MIERLGDHLLLATWVEFQTCDLVRMGSGGFLNANLAEYHMAVNADIGDYSVGFIDKPDHLVNPNEHVPLAEQRAQFSVRLGDLRALFVAA